MGKGLQFSLGEQLEKALQSHRDSSDLGGSAQREASESPLEEYAQGIAQYASGGRYEDALYGIDDLIQENVDDIQLLQDEIEFFERVRAVLQRRMSQSGAVYSRELFLSVVRRVLVANPKWARLYKP